MICAASVYFMLLMQDLMLPVVISYVNASIDTNAIGFKRRSSFSQFQSNLSVTKVIDASIDLGLWLGDKWLAFVWKVAGFIFTVCSSLSVSLGMDFYWGNMACWCKVLRKIKPKALKNSNGQICHATSMKEGMEIKHALNARLDIKHTKTALRKDPSLPFESCCLPVADKGSSRSSNFLVKSLLSNSSLGQSQSQDVAWTYFAVEVPSSVAMKINAIVGVIVMTPPPTRFKALFHEAEVKRQSILVITKENDLARDGDFLNFSVGMLHFICSEAKLKGVSCLNSTLPIYFISLMYNRDIVQNKWGWE
nr:transmembrane protein-related protein [Tanacetum cinerariifolium]